MSRFATLLCPIALAIPSSAQDRPLECLKRFKQDEFVIGSWGFHDSAKYDARYHKRFRDLGFNTIIHCLCNLPAKRQPGRDDYFGAALDGARAAGVRVLLHTARAHGPWGAWDGVEFPEEKYGKGHGGYVKLPGLQWLHENYGKHPALAGYLLGDDDKVRPDTLECAQWLAKHAPTMVPYMAENYSPQVQADSGCMPILSTQNYPWRRRLNEQQKRGMYCNFLYADREFSHANGMAFWPIFLTTHRSGSSPSQLRFQAFMPIVYGAQGIFWFAYQSTDAKWQPGGDCYEQARYCNSYLRDVVGPRVLGSRCASVFHAPAWKRCEEPGVGKWIEHLDEDLRAGLLVSERDFEKGRDRPAFIMVVDYRTVDPGQKEPRRRRVRIRLSKWVKGITVLRHDGKRSTKRGREATFQLKAGEGILLAIKTR